MLWKALWEVLKWDLIMSLQRDMWSLPQGCQPAQTDFLTVLLKNPKNQKVHFFHGTGSQHGLGV